MGNNKINEYKPDVISHPGTTLNHILKSLEMSQSEFAQRTGRPKKTINEIIKGKTAITPETALQFEKVLKTPISFWINREKRYREYLARKKEAENLQIHIDWIKNFPLNEMAKYRWIKKLKDDIEQLIELLTFYSVASPPHWKEIWKSHESMYRRTEMKSINLYLISAWLRQGEIEAQNIECTNYNKKSFSDSLIKARTLTNQKPQEFIPILKGFLACTGVALVFVPELNTLGVYGATRWLSSNKALIQLSLRYKSNDHLWFTFFHEAAHILLHGKSKEFVEIKNHKSGYEDEANEFSRNFLIPKHSYIDYLKKTEINKPSILNFANSVGIHPGIVVGRLQHDNYMNFNQYNSLKSIYEWTI